MDIKVELSNASKTIKKYKDEGYIYLGGGQKGQYATLHFTDTSILKENESDIKFHEGDFVEDNNGRVGYISSICDCEECKKRGFCEPTITYSDGTEDYISNHSVQKVPYDYKQIGIQKFDLDYFKNRTINLEKEILQLRLEIKKVGR